MQHVDSDEAYARHIDQLCNECDDNPKVTGFDLCVECYEQRQQSQMQSLLAPRRQYATFDSNIDNANINNAFFYNKATLYNNTDTPEDLRERKCDRLPVQRGKSEGECPVCINEYMESESIITLPCFHILHEACCRRWVRHRAKCPVCMTDI